MLKETLPFGEWDDEDNRGLRYLEPSTMDKSAIYAFLQNGGPGRAAQILDGLFSRIGEQPLKSPLLRLYIVTDIHLAAKSFAQSIGISRNGFFSQ